jgi:hypothetical protein
MKRLIVILFLALVGVRYCDWAWLEAQLAASAQAQRPAPNTQASSSAPVDYSKFKHSTHAGEVAVPGKNTKQKLDCQYCHGAAVKETLDIQITGYPSKKQGLAAEKTHSACRECHVMEGRLAVTSGIYPKMCLICHTTLNNLSAQSQNLRQFPNPTVVESQFGDGYSHSDHVSFYDTVKVRFECAACHEKFVNGVRQPAGVYELVPQHPPCFVCHLDEKKVSKRSSTFAEKCSGCHLPLKPGGKVLPAVHQFVRQIVTVETKPFSHKTHEKELGKDTKTCLECHATGKTANKRTDFFGEDKKTKQKQPLVSNCIQCHDKEAQQKIGDTVKLENSKCLFCHKLDTIQARAASGLPPLSHFGKKAAPTPTPAPKLETKPETKPEAKPETKTETKPAPTAPKPESPAAKPEPPKPEPAKPEAAKPAPSSTAEPAAASRALPTKLVLGDPKVSPHWGRDRGVVAFDHTTHIQPAYAERCEVCHHTNKDARKEAVPKCVECHKEEGHPGNAKNKAGEPIDVKTAYHGSPDNENNNAGCIECHKRYYDRNPDRERKGPTSKCADCHAEKQAILRPSWLRAWAWTRHALRLAGH